jgi:membrane-associated phospholipid phosphatase
VTVPVSRVPDLLRHRVLWVCAVAFAGSVAAAMQLTDGVLENGDLSRVDPIVAVAVPSERTSALTVVARFMDLVGSTAVVGALAVVLVVVLWFRVRDRVAAAWVAAAMGTAGILILGVKHLVGRVRPGADLVLGAVDTSPAFPSGHTLGTTVFLGLVAGLALTRSRSLAVRWVAVAGWLLGSVAMAASRVYLGYHWMTDVLAGLALGSAVLALTALAVVGARRGRRPES